MKIRIEAAHLCGEIEAACRDTETWFDVRFVANGGRLCKCSGYYPHKVKLELSEHKRDEI